MFYSETLLSKTGPLARVWLSANIERKVLKKDVLDQNIESSVSAIVDQGQAPLALRLSGQLLLGVVRIYSRKARYLQGDADEIIHQLKMAFRPGNVDLPLDGPRTNTDNLLLPDVITDLDLFAPLPDPSLLLPDFDGDMSTSSNLNLLDFGSSQRLPSTFERARRASTEPSGLLPDIDLGLDLGDDIFGRSSRERSIEVGRDAPAPRTIEDEMNSTGFYNGPDLGLDLGEPEVAPQRPAQDSSIIPGMGEDDFQMGGMMDEHRMAPVPDAFASAHLPMRQQRQTLSPLSSIRSSAEREMERTFNPEGLLMPEQDEETIHHAQRAKRRKILQADVETEMRSAEIRALQQDRSKILKAPQFLSRDPVLLALMQMQREGNFVSNILSDGMQRGLAPELRGVLSLELVKQSAERKRKRDAGLPTPPPEGADKNLQLQIPADEEELNQPGDAFDFGNDTTIGADNARTTIEGDDQPVLPDQSSRPGTQERNLNDDEEPTLPNEPDNFDETVMPILHPKDAGPVSLGTKHAVHALRERFGPDAASTSTPSKRTQASVLFQDMLPEKTTTRADATKMFFEVLVLATKDAIKVEQDGDEVGGPLRVRGKRGLWGSWADERLTEQTEAGVVKTSAA